MDEHFSNSITDAQKTANMELAFGQNELGRTLLDDLGFSFNPGEASEADAYFIQNSTGRRFDLKEFRKYLNEKDNLNKAMRSKERNSLLVTAAVNTDTIGKMMYPTGRPSSLEQYMALDAGLSPTGAGLSANMKVPGAAQAAGWRNPAADALTRMDQERDWWDTLTDPNVPVASSQNAANPSAHTGSDYFAQGTEGYEDVANPVVQSFINDGVEKDKAETFTNSIIKNTIDRFNKIEDKGKLNPMEFNRIFLEEINFAREDSGLPALKYTGAEEYLLDQYEEQLTEEINESKKILKQMRKGREELYSQYESEYDRIRDETPIRKLEYRGAGSAPSDRHSSQIAREKKIKELNDRIGMTSLKEQERQTELELFRKQDRMAWIKKERDKVKEYKRDQKRKSMANAYYKQRNTDYLNRFVRKQPTTVKGR